MATCLKRTSKFYDLSLLQSSVNISIQDLMCPVCRSILIEPVTLPCTHNLCLKCLKGTFEHNSLSCPLCRVRVGSWLRTATKTEKLVNSDLWELIQTKFSKEVESKYNGDERSIDLDVEFTGANKIVRQLSASGEIRQEYEAQLQMAKEEMQCQRKAEQIASEALIRKIQEEEHQQLVQLTQDELLAKTLVKEQIKHKPMSKYNNSFNASNTSFNASKYNVKCAITTDVKYCNVESHGSKCRKTPILTPLLEPQFHCGLTESNIALISKIHAERIASSAKNNAYIASACNYSSNKLCCQKAVPVCNAISKTLKHQIAKQAINPCVSKCSLEPRTSSSKIYGTQSKEELHIPNDVVNNKNKSLGIEVCVSSCDDDERMGSAGSTGSHDSINQEIHHFKPIKSIPRTPLKISPDGKQLDPKLIRVIPVLRKIPNAIPKPPCQTHLKRIIGCSWSAFKRRTKQNSKEKDVNRGEIEQQPSTSSNQSHIPSKLKLQTLDSIRKLDFGSELSFDSNKNYTKNANQIINGTRISKRLILEEYRDIKKVQNSWKPCVINGMMYHDKSKCLKTIKYINNTETRDSTPSVTMEVNSPSDKESELQENNTTIENIAERIKKRKINTDKKDNNSASLLNLDVETIAKRNTRKRLCKKNEFENVDVPVIVAKRSKTKFTALSKSKQRSRVRPMTQSNIESSEKSNISLEFNGQINNSDLRKVTRKLRCTNNSVNTGLDITYNNTKSNNYNSSESCSERRDCILENNTTEAKIAEETILSDEEVVQEQERLERLVMQEKEDFELAQRLQAKFDEMERIAGRTRRSRRAIESETIELDLYKIDSRNNIKKTMNSHTAKSSVINHSMNIKAKKRGRPPKRVK